MASRPGRSRLARCVPAFAASVRVRGGLWRWASDAERHAIDLSGARATVEKVMSTAAPRRIARLVARIEPPLPPDHPHRGSLEAVAHACPVQKSLHPEIDAPVEFVWKGSR